MTAVKKEAYGVLGPPKTQPRTQDFDKIRGCKVSGRKGRGEKICLESLTNLSLNEETRNGDAFILETEASLKGQNNSGNNAIIFY